MYVPNTDQKPPSDLSSPRQPMFHPEHRAKRAITVLLFLLGFPERHVPGRAEQKKKAGREGEGETERERDGNMCRHCGGEGNGTPLQYSCLENPTDGGA